jgi:hypothetical protein
MAMEIEMGKSFEGLDEFQAQRDAIKQRKLEKRIRKETRKRKKREDEYYDGE